MKQEEQKFAGQLPQGQSSRSRVDADTTLFTENYGGLNKTSNSVNQPFSDSPDMLNCKVSLSGTVAKRDGSFIREVATGTPDGTIITTFTLRSGKVLLISKLGTSLAVSLLPEKETYISSIPVITYTNVWSAVAKTQKPSFVWTSEAQPRLLMACSANTVVELEVSQLDLVGVNTTKITITGDFTGSWSKDYSFGIYGNNVITVSSITAVGTTTEIVFSSVIPTGQAITLIQPVWHWWAEALKRTSDQLYNSTYRFNTSVNADANVAIPDELRRGLEADSISLKALLAYGVKPLLVWKTNTSSPTAFTFDSTPDDKDEYAFSNKVYTTGAGADYITPGTAYLTFGGIDGGGTFPPTPIHLVRQLYLPFNGGNGCVCTDIQVYNASGLLLQARYNVASAANSATDQYYWLLDNSFAVETTNTDVVKIITFCGGYPYGTSEAFVEIINTKVTTSIIGSSAVATYYSAKTPGTYRPWYGASLYANFNSGVFPSVIGLFQDRLVLSGYGSAPLTVLLSNLSNNGSRYNYQNFQVDFDDTQLAYNPIEVVLDGVTDDIVTNVIPWFNSLFVTTKKTTRRIYGGTNAAVTPSSISQNTVSGVGCSSRQGAVRTDESVLFISDSGLFSIQVLSQSGEYTTENISIKVQDYFTSNSSNPSNSWLFYNQLTDEVWIGLSSVTDSYIPSVCLVYFNRREAWSEYGLSSGFMPSVFGCSDSKRPFLCLVNRDTGVLDSPGATSKTIVAEFNLQGILTDVTSSPTNAQLVAGYTTNNFHRTVLITVDSDQRSLSLLPNKLSSLTNNGFKLLPLADRVVNFTVRKYNGLYWEDLSYTSNDFVVYPSNSSIKILTTPFYTGEIVEVKLVNDDGYDALHLFRDNLELTSVTDYTVVVDGLFHKVTTTGAGNANNVYLLGETIRAWHFTPTFFRQSGISNLKRVVHYSGYYSNKYYQELWDATDVNSSSGQTVSSISDIPKVEAGASLGILYNDSRSGSYESELYGTSDLYWDSSMFDFLNDAFRNQLNDVVRTSVPIMGVGYSFQVVNFNSSTKRFELIAYSVQTASKGRNSTRWY
jgi:hypothetical protein